MIIIVYLSIECVNTLFHKSFYKKKKNPQVTATIFYISWHRKCIMLGIKFYCCWSGMSWSKSPIFCAIFYLECVWKYFYSVFLREIFSLEMFLRESFISVSPKNITNDFSILKVIFLIFKSVSLILLNIYIFFKKNIF